MPTTIAEIVTAITDAYGGIIPMTTLALFAFFSFVVSAGFMLVKRSIRAAK